MLHAGKYNWTYVLGTGLMDPLYRGHTTIVHEGATDATLWPARIARHGATVFIGVPTIYRQILQKTACARADVPTLRHCMSAGEQLSADVLAAWRERFGLEIYEALGMTECSYYLCETRARPIRPGSAGFVQPGHDVRLLDPDTLRDVGSGAEGMLCIRRTDPGLMLRYWNQPEETAACIRGDWFLTGDYARIDDDGYVWFLGRRDDLINTFGYRVSPHEVERVLKSHPDVADAAAVGGDGRTREDARGRLRGAARGRADGGRPAGVGARAAGVVQGAAHRLSRRRPAAHAQRQGPAPGAPSRAVTRARPGVIRRGGSVRCRAHEKTIAQPRPSSLTRIYLAALLARRIEKDPGVPHGLSQVGGHGLVLVRRERRQLGSCSRDPGPDEDGAQHDAKH